MQSESTGPCPARVLPAMFVWTVWGVATGLGFVATAVYGRWLPWSDDFAIVPFVTGDQTVTLRWLWDQHNEHRIPLVKLFFIGLGRLSGCDYRWTSTANAMILSFTAALMVLTARQLRGRSTWTDAFFPAFMLHLGQGGLMWAFHTQFLLTTFLGGLFVAAAVAAPRGAVWRAAVMATSACLMPLTGSSGLLMAGAAVCLLAAEALGWNRPTTGRAVVARSVAAAGGCVALAIAVAYVATLTLGPSEGYASPWQTFVAGLDTLTSYPGHLINRSRTAWRIGTLVAVLGTMVVAARASWRTPGESRGRWIILSGYLAALGLVAVAVGYGRGTRDFTPLYIHYSTLMLGVPVAIGLVWASLPQSAVARGIQIGLCTAALLVAGIQAKLAIRHMGSDREATARIATDIRGQLTPDEVAVRHGAALFFIDTPSTRGMIATALGSLRRTTYPLYCTRPSEPSPAEP